MSAPSQIVEDMAFLADTPKLTPEKIDALIEWVRTGAPPPQEVITHGDLLKALITLRVNRKMG